MSVVHRFRIYKTHREVFIITNTSQHSTLHTARIFSVALARLAMVSATNRLRVASGFCLLLGGVQFVFGVSVFQVISSDPFGAW